MVRASRHEAFTLIELLVVIAVIALLVSILMPSLSRSLDLSREVACRHNQRSIYVTLHVYASDHDARLPDAWHIMERQWVGWNYDRFLHNRLKNYIEPRSPMWLDPGWPKDKPYQDTVRLNGTPDNPAAGSVPSTPLNFGMTYYYTAWFWVYYWSQPGDTTRHEQEAPKVRFDRVREPNKAKVMSCLLPQQDPTLGTVGPHKQGTTWEILWLDGSLTTTKGYFAPVRVFDNYCNFVGDWTPK